MSTNDETNPLRWDLESLWPGGCAGEPASQLAEQARSDLAAIASAVGQLPPLSGAGPTLSTWAGVLRRLEEIDDHIEEAYALAECTLAADVTDKDARDLVARVHDMLSQRRQIDVPVWSGLGEADDESFSALSEHSELTHMELHLQEQRAWSEISMDPELEQLHEELARDGFHSWSRLYDEVTGGLRVEVDRGEGPEQLGVGQARNLLESPDRALRKRVAAAIHDAFDSQKALFAAAFNHINGYREVLYRRRGIDELTVPCRLNRIERRTLDTMWSAVHAFRPTMARFLAAKARALGLEKPSWYDVDVPLGEAGASVDYATAQDFIVSEFSEFSGAMGEFAKMAFDQRWIEAEDRSGKAQGGFCASFPLSKQTRIFMTYGNTPGSVQTLAHELGHAYHAWLLRDLRAKAREVPATLAETASTFAESLVREAALRRADRDEVRLGLLDRKLTDAVAMLMNIPARFKLDRAAFAERRKRELSPERYTELTLEAFEEAHAGALAEYEELFWASKLHFYFTQLPFYNFPYTFGYLFSLGLYARALEEGSDFAPQYDETLMLTGGHTVEEVARRALGVDLGEPEFWNDALALIAADVSAFETLAG